MVVQYEICGLGGGSVSGSRDGQPGYITCPDPIEGFSCKIVTNIARKRKRCHHVPLQQHHFDTMNCNVRRRPDCGVWRSPLPCALLCARHAGGTAFTQDYPTHISHTHIPHSAVYPLFPLPHPLTQWAGLNSRSPGCSRGAHVQPSARPRTRWPAGHKAPTGKPSARPSQSAQRTALTGHNPTSLTQRPPAATSSFSTLPPP